VNDTIARYQKLLQQHPDNELARFSLGKAHFDLGHFAAAKEQFALALARRPDWMAVQILLGRCELALHNRNAARIALERARQLAIEQDHAGPLAEVEQLLAELA
jgi:Flp pilus assembly protein TadD